HPWPPARHARDEADVQLARLLLEQAVLEANAGRAEALTASAGVGTGIAQGDDDASHLGFDQRIHARRRASVMRAGLERDVDARAGRVDSLERAHLGVRSTGVLVPAFA